MSSKIRLVRTKKELEQALKVRYEVFVRGQNVPLDREQDEFEKTSKHAIIFSGKRVIGTARIRFLKNKAKLERIAVLDSYQGKGIGKQLMKYLISYCKRKKVKEITMGAQCYIVNFYKQFGFTERGRVFMDAGIKHKEMYLRP